MAKASNGSSKNHPLDETTATLQQAMATLLQNQVLFVSRAERLEERMDRKFSEFDHRLGQIEVLLKQMFAELPERVFGCGQAQKKQ